MNLSTYRADGLPLAELGVDAIVPAGPDFVPDTYLVLLSDGSQVTVHKEWLCRYYGDTWRDLLRPPLTELQQSVVRTMHAWCYYHQANVAANAWMRNLPLDPPAIASPKRAYRQFLADFAECNRQALACGAK